MKITLSSLQSAIVFNYNFYKHCASLTVTCSRHFYKYSAANICKLNIPRRKL